MATPKQSAIQWTGPTWNPWYGCKKVSPGCKYCYAERDMSRYNKDFKAVTRSKTGFNKPLSWKDPQLIFTCSWSDWFIEEADQWRKEAWEIIKSTPHHTYQILTKRPERITENLPEDWGPNGYKNVWIGVSIESQSQIDRLNHFSDFGANIRFASFEPLIGRIDLFKAFSMFEWECDKCQAILPQGHLQEVPSPCEKCGCIVVSPMGTPVPLDWAIIGGESGNETGKHKYREMQLEWMLDLSAQLQDVCIPVFIKQLGAYQAKKLGLKDRKGGDISEFPMALQLRQFPDRENSVI